MRTPASVPSPARGSEISEPGADQRRRPWLPSAHRGRIYTEAFPHGHRSRLSRLLHFSFLFIWQAVRPSPHGCRWIAHSLLGERRLSLVFHGRRFEWPFLLARVQFPIIRVDFLRHFKLLVDPAASHQVDTVSTQFLPTVSNMHSQPKPAETSATAAATPAGRAVQVQVHAQGSAPAPHPGCSQSSQPDRAVSAVAADQPPGRPRFIALPPGSVGSVIQDELPEVANAAKVLPPSSHGVEHFIATKEQPIASKFWRLDTEKLQAAKAE